MLVDGAREYCFEIVGSKCYRWLRKTNKIIWENIVVMCFKAAFNYVEITKRSTQMIDKISAFDMKITLRSLFCVDICDFCHE